MKETLRKRLDYLEDPVLGLGLLDFVLGEYLGSGIYRDVYEYALDKNWVIKIENKDGNGENWAEWRLYHAIKYSEHKKWFAECKWISDNGLIMMQRKTEEFSKKEKKLPKKIPNYFTDVKQSNFGWIGNQLVCHDYSFTLEKLTSCGGISKRMKSSKELK